MIVTMDSQNVQSQPALALANLTEMERRVGELVAGGMSNRAVADELFLSRHTIDFHLRRIYRKLGVNNRVQLARLLLTTPADHADSVGPGRESDGLV